VLLNNLLELRRKLSEVGKLKKSVESCRSSVGQLHRLRVKCGVQLGVIWKKLNVVASGGRRKLSVVTDGSTGKRPAVLNFLGRHYYASPSQGFA
jgi:hypothetical protein